MVPALAVMLCGCSQEDSAKGYINTKNCPDTEPDKPARGKCTNNKKQSISVR